VQVAKTTGCRLQAQYPEACPACMKHILLSVHSEQGIEPKEAS
jgi:hypothetical protein